MNVKQLKALAESLGVKFPSDIKKADLQALIDKAQAALDAKKPDTGSNGDGTNNDGDAGSGGDGTTSTNTDDTGDAGSGDDRSTSRDTGNYDDAEASGFVSVNCAVRGGRRRAGRRWPGGVTEVPAADFTDDMDAALAGDPMFTVSGLTE